VTKETGVSHRHLARLFRQQVGITPKLCCRVHRVQRVVHRISAGAAVD
jgi:methylphosphotriester-DNA--protein-cysteine methyltransferase